MLKYRTVTCIRPRDRIGYNLYTALSSPSHHIVLHLCSMTSNAVLFDTVGGIIYQNRKQDANGLKKSIRAVSHTGGEATGETQENW